MGDIGSGLVIVALMFMMGFFITVFPEDEETKKDE